MSYNNQTQVYLIEIVGACKSNFLNSWDHLVEGGEPCMLYNYFIYKLKNCYHDEWFWFISLVGGISIPLEIYSV